MQVAAIAFVVILIVAMAVGCAKYDGDQVAFCDQLEDAPSFMQLSARANEGTDAQAAATMQAAAEQFRQLERVAPRSIRATVAALGDSAERIAHGLAPQTTTTRVLTVHTDDGSIRRIPLPTSPSQARLDVFYNEMQNHHGTVSAVYSLMTYARDTCGITDHNLDLGMFGYGPGTPDFGGPRLVDPGLRGDGQPLAPGTPGGGQTTVPPSPGAPSLGELGGPQPSLAPPATTTH